MASASSQSVNLKVANLRGQLYRQSPVPLWRDVPLGGFDCSGMTQYVYRHYGRSIPRTADAQFRYFHRESRARPAAGTLSSST